MSFWFDLRRALAGPAPLSVCIHCGEAVENPDRVGICGNTAPRLVIADTCSIPSHCTLPAGHKGWHADDVMNSHWGRPEREPNVPGLLAYFNRMQANGAVPYQVLRDLRALVAGEELDDA